MSQNNVSFAVSEADGRVITDIVKRGIKMAKEAGRRDIGTLDAKMDITAVHTNGHPLKLDKFLAADDFNFAHDFFGINRHINRDTGGLNSCFSPRFHA